MTPSQARYQLRHTRIFTLAAFATRDILSYAFCFDKGILIIFLVFSDNIRHAFADIGIGRSAQIGRGMAFIALPVRDLNPIFILNRAQHGDILCQILIVDTAQVRARLHGLRLELPYLPPLIKVLMPKINPTKGRVCRPRRTADAAIKHGVQAARAQP